MAEPGFKPLSFLCPNRYWNRSDTESEFSSESIEWSSAAPGKNIVNDNKSIAAVNVQVYETRRAYKCRCEAVYSRRSTPRSIPHGQHRTPAPDGYRYSRSRHCMVTSDSPAAGTQHQPMSCHRYIYSTNTYRHTISYISVTNLLLLLLLLLLLILGYRHQRADERHDNPPPR